MAAPSSLPSAPAEAPLPTVVVTGVSSGIGYDIVRELTGRGFFVFGSVRTAQDAARLRADFPARFEPLVFDVRDVPALAAAVKQVQQHLQGRGLAGLINNAGISSSGPLNALSFDKFKEHFEVNVYGVFLVTRAFLPLLGARRRCPHPPGRIVNMGSVSGKIAYPFMGAYAASKHALEALTDALRREMLVYGIEVILLQPGNIQSRIWEKTAHISTAFDHTDYGLVLKGLDILATGAKALPPARVSRVVFRALTARRPRTRYAIPDDWIFSWIGPRLLPDRWLDAIVGRNLSLFQLRHVLQGKTQ